MWLLDRLFKKEYIKWILMDADSDQYLGNDVAARLKLIGVLAAPCIFHNYELRIWGR